MGRPIGSRHLRLSLRLQDHRCTREGRPQGVPGDRGRPGRAGGHGSLASQQTARERPHLHHRHREPPRLGVVVAITPIRVRPGHVEETAEVVKSSWAWGEWFEELERLDREVLEVGQKK